MSALNIREKVQLQYEKHPYPTPEDCVKLASEGKRMQFGYPNHFFHNIWPYRAYDTNIDILVAGCGSIQAVELAAANPEMNIIGIDLSKESLNYSQYLCDKYNIKNLKLKRLEIENVKKLNKKFDLVISTGVIHHMADPEEGMRELGKVLKDDGTFYIMLYGKYGRDAIYYLQDLLSEMGFSIENTSEEQIKLMYEVFNSLPQEHPIHRRKELFFNLFSGTSEVIDAFLHPRDTAYSLPDIFKILDKTGLKMQKLLSQADYLPRFSNLCKTSSIESINKMPIEKQYIIGELFRASAIKHNFYACHKSRDKKTYDINFNIQNWKKMIPVRYPALEYDQKDLILNIKSSWHVTEVKAQLHEVHSTIFSYIDDKRSIEEMEELLKFTDTQEHVDNYLKHFFKDLLALEYIYFNASGV